MLPAWASQRLFKLSKGHTESKSFLLCHQHSTTGNSLHMNSKYVASGAGSTLKDCVPWGKLPPYFSFYFYFLKILFIHKRYTQRERQRHGQRAKQAPCREPYVRLDPRSPGSHPGAKPLSHPGCPRFYFLVISMPNTGLEFTILTSRVASCRD